MFCRLRFKGVMFPFLFFMLPVAPAMAVPAVDAPVLQETKKAGVGTPDSELAAAKAAVKEEPSNPAAHSRLGNLLLQRGALDEAIGSFDHSLALNRRLVEAKTGKGIALARKGKLAEAEQVLKEALRQNPDPIRVHYELGLVYEKMGDSARACAEFKEGIKNYMRGRR